MKEIKKYDWKKTAVKGCFVLGEIVIAGTIAYIADNPAFLVIAPALEIVLDWLKHRSKN